jgi:hypothetical protein
LNDSFKKLGFSPIGELDAPGRTGANNAPQQVDAVVAKPRTGEIQVEPPGQLGKCAIKVDGTFPICGH